MSEDPNSTVKRVAFRGKETETHLLTADNMSVRRGPDGGAVLELFAYNDKGRAVESFRFYLCPEDRARVREAL